MPCTCNMIRLRNTRPGELHWESSLQFSPHTKGINKSPKRWVVSLTAVIIALFETLDMPNL